MKTLAPKTLENPFYAPETDWVINVFMPFNNCLMRLSKRFKAVKTPSGTVYLTTRPKSLRSPIPINIGGGVIVNVTGNDFFLSTDNLGTFHCKGNLYGMVYEMTPATENEYIDATGWKPPYKSWKEALQK